MMKKMRFMPRHARVLFGALLASGLVAGGATAAQAAYPSDCPSPRVCLYADAGYVSQMGWKNAPFGAYDISSGNNDKLSSWSNHSTTNATWHDDAGQAGGCHNMGALSSNYELDLFSRDHASSWKGNGAC